MPRRTKEEAEQTRRKILEAALDVFSQKGFVRTALGDIAEKAGYTRGAVYWHFKNKADLFMALAEDIEKSTGVDFESLAEARVQSLDDIREFILLYLSLFETNKRYRRFYEMIYFRTEWTEELDPVLSYSRKETRFLVKKLTRDFQRLRQKKLVRADLDPRLAAIAICVYVEGLINAWVLDNKLFSLKKDAPALVDIFLKSFSF